MTVYVDDQLREATIRHGNHLIRGRWSNLLADQTTELLSFGARLGLHPSWLRMASSPLEHFTVSAGKRQLAIELGADELEHQEALELVRAKRVGAPFDLTLLRADPDAFAVTLSPPTRPDPSSGPHRVRLSRNRPLPPGTVSVAAPTRWASPYRPAARTPAAAAAAVDHFRGYLSRNPALVQLAQAELTGLNLACWCSPHLPCHADVWLALVNHEREEPPGPPSRPFSR